MSIKVKNYFQATTKDFDSLYAEENALKYFLNKISRKGLYERVTLTLKELDEPNSFSVCDIGCGSGRNSVLFAKAGASEVLGIDFSENMIALAKEYSSRNNISEICKFIPMDFLNYSNEEKFDYCIALGVFDYLNDPHAFIKKMKGLSRKKVIISFSGKSLIRAPLRAMRYKLKDCPLYFYDNKMIAELFKKAGFSEYKIIPYSSSGYLGVGMIKSAK